MIVNCYFEQFGQLIVDLTSGITVDFLALH